MATTDPEVLYQQVHNELVAEGASIVMLAKIDAIFHDPALTPQAAPVPAPAYDTPVLDVGQVKVDGRTVNRDGSIWGLSPGGSPGGPSGMGPVWVVFGYISPAKTPEIWEWARTHLPPETFMRWDAAWQANPYGLYRADARDLVKSGRMDFVMFGYLLNAPFATFKQ